MCAYFNNNNITVKIVCNVKYEFVILFGKRG